MAAQIPASDVKALLAELGYAIPDAVLNLLFCQLEKIQDCLDGAGYDECTQQLIQLYAMCLMSASSGARKIKSQGAPSGASRSFDYGEDGLTQLREALRVIDTAGCSTALPITVSPPVGMFMVVGGGR